MVARCFRQLLEITVYYVISERITCAQVQVGYDSKFNFVFDHIPSLSSLSFFLRNGDGAH